MKQEKEIIVNDSDWIEFFYDNRPQVPGVYGIKHYDTWLYIGYARNIKNRCYASQHPAFIFSEDLTGASYWYIESWDYTRLERACIKKYSPYWYGVGFCNDFYLSTFLSTGREYRISSYRSPTRETQLKMFSDIDWNNMVG